jgi:hypothetical protein
VDSFGVAGLLAGPRSKAAGGVEVSREKALISVIKSASQIHSKIS